MESRYKTWAYLRGGLETSKEIDTLYILQASPHKYCYSWQSFQDALHSSEIISRQVQGRQPLYVATVGTEAYILPVNPERNISQTFLSQLSILIKQSQTEL